MDQGLNTYTRYDGLAELRQALAKRMSGFNQMIVNPETEVTVSAGATGAFHKKLLLDTPPACWGEERRKPAERAEFGSLRCVSLKRTRGAVYDLKYHVVWVPNYRRMVLGERVPRRLKRIFQEIAEWYEFEIDTQEVLDDHGHIFLSAPPRYSPAQVVQRLKSISARLVFQEFPEVKQQLWGGELWNDDYFVRSVEDTVTAEVIRRYIKHQ